MGSVVLPVLTATKPRVLTRVVLVKGTDLPPGRESFCVVAVGVMRAGRFQAIGTFDGRKNGLKAGEAWTLFDGERGLAEGDTVVVEAYRAGSAASVEDAAVIAVTRPRTVKAGQGSDQGVESYLDSVGGLEREHRVGLAGLFSDAAYPRVLYTSDATLNISNTATETTLFSDYVPAATLQSGRAVRLRIYGTLLNNSGANRTINLRVVFGGTDVFNDVSGAYAAAATRYPWYFEVTIPSRVTVAFQSAFGIFWMGPASAAASGIGDFGAGATFFVPFANDSLAIDAQIQQALSVLWTHSAANANLTCTRYYYSLEVV